MTQRVVEYRQLERDAVLSEIMNERTVLAMNQAQEIDRLRMENTKLMQENGRLLEESAELKKRLNGSMPAEPAAE